MTPLYLFSRPDPSHAVSVFNLTTDRAHGPMEFSLVENIFEN